MTTTRALAADTLQSIQYTRGQLRLLDQRRLPLQTVYDDIVTVQDVWTAIREMRVRGAPAIAVSAALGIAVAAAHALAHGTLTTPHEVLRFVDESCAYVITSRPTAVNLDNCLRDVAAQLRAAVTSPTSTLDTAAAAVDVVTTLAEAVYAADVSYNERIMQHGAQYIWQRKLQQQQQQQQDDDDDTTEEAKGVRILTICNPGALATARYGTALGVVRQLFYDGHLAQLYACETRPWNQGARLTVYECVQEKMPCTLICDSAAAALLARKQHKGGNSSISINEIDAVVVGADRICANGDTANKIGTYSLAVAARHHGVPFYVAAPTTTLDAHMRSGDDVVIEERDGAEMTTDAVTGRRLVAAGPTLRVWNPVFNVTPAALITGGIITELGVTTPAACAPYYDVPALLATAAAQASTTTTTHTTMVL